MTRTSTFILVAAAAAMLSLSCSQQTQAPAQGPDFSQINADADAFYATAMLAQGSEAPDFKMQTLQGDSLSLSDLKGKWVVLDFWASWCPDCVKDAPNMARLSKQFAPHGVQFIGISMDTDKEKWGAAAQKYGLDYPHVSELIKFKDTKIAAAYGIQWIPSVYLISPEGQVELATVLSDKLEKKLNELFPDTTPVPGKKEELTLQGSKGKLAAILQTPEMAEGGRYPLVIQMHGFSGRKEGPLFEIMADTLARNGIATLRFDFNGHGQSEGAFSEMTVPNEIEDAKMVYEYAASLPWVSSISFVGHSQGGVVASMAAGELGAAKVKSVVLMAPAAVLREDAIRGSTFGVMYNPIFPPDSVELYGGLYLGKDYIRTAFRLPIYETAAGYTGPAMIIHGTADKVVPYTYGKRYTEIWPNSEYIELEGVDHGFSQNIYKATATAAHFFIRQTK